MTDCANERLLWICVITEAYRVAQRGNGHAKAFFFSEVFLQVGHMMFTPDQVSAMQIKAMQCKRKERIYKPRIKPTVVSGWQTGIEISECF